MKKHICLLLVICLLLSALLAGCGSDEKKIIGKWTADIDYTDAFNTGLHSAKGLDKNAKHFEAEEFIVTTTLIFREDGSYSMVIEDSAAQKALQDIEYILYDGFESVLKEQFSQLGLPFSVEQYLQNQTHVIWGMVDDALTDKVKEDLLDNLVNTHTGNYRIADSKIYMTQELTEELTEENYDTYTLEKDTLTLLECHCNVEDEYQDIAKSIYPVTFTRVIEDN